MKHKPTFSRIITCILISFLFLTNTHAQVVLYGLTSGGGDSAHGTIFSVTPSGNLTTITNLNSIYAAVPWGSLLYASDGNFYASSIDGGYKDSCTIFRCTPIGVQKTMINLDSVWGASVPEGNSLIQGMDGNLYGMTTQGGPHTFGVLFKLQLSGHYTALHFFSGFSDGMYPKGSLIQTNDSNLWGMTSAGGSHGLGNIFHCSPAGTLVSVFSFDTLDGTTPNGDLLLANDGNFYGLTSKGGKYKDGTLFRYNPSGIYTKMVDFNDANGKLPMGSLIQAADGNLYGLTSGGGDSGYGTLFVCTLAGNLTTLVNFNDENGNEPQGALIQASDENFYGMTTNGGNFNDGTIFQYSLSSGLTKMDDFNYANGAYPMYGKLIEVDKLLGINEIKVTNNTANLYPNPNLGVFTMVLNGVDNGKEMSIYNVLGEKIYNTTLKAKTTQIDLSNKAEGVYFYRVLTENGEPVSEGKFIIQLK